VFIWGVTLMFVGALSFVLPLAGRQFVLVSALGLTGANSVLVGIVVFAIGLVLFLSADKAHSGTAPRADPSNSPGKPLEIVAHLRALKPLRRSRPKMSGQILARLLIRAGTVGSRSRIAASWTPTISDLGLCQAVSEAPRKSSSA